MIKEVSEKLLGQFVVNLETKLAATQNAEPGPGAGGGSTIGSAAAAGATSPRPAPAAAAPEALDLMELAGGAVYKRLLPLAIGVVVVVVLVILRRRVP